LKVTHLNGERIGFFRALWRVVTSIVSGLILGVGFLVAAFTERRQALHDIFASTLVVRRQFDAETVKTAAPAESSGGALAIVVVVVGFGGVMMLGVMAAISIPAYQDYLTRSRIAEALMLARQAAMNVTDFTEQRKTPPTSLAEAGFTGTSPFVQSIALDPQTGAIRVVMAAPQMIAGKAFVLTPTRESNGETRWRCGTEGVQERYLPRDCRREGR
jgi:Tfp pilus assembly protein PilE